MIICVKCENCFSKSVVQGNSSLLIGSIEQIKTELVKKGFLDYFKW